MTSTKRQIKTLILAGTSEASQLARLLVDESEIAPIASFAGRTKSLKPPPIPYRMGGFGGVDGLAHYLESEEVDAVIDATHPFAAQMSSNAAEACRRLNLPLLRLERPAWAPVEGDRWASVTSMAEAAEALGSDPKRVFLPIGKLEVAPFEAAPQHHYLLRAVDAFAIPAGLTNAELITARGPFGLVDEIALMRQHRIDIVVSKNSGASATEAKISAARRLGLPVIMVERPSLPEAETVATAEEALNWLRSAHPASTRRGV